MSQVNVERHPDARIRAICVAGLLLSWASVQADDKLAGLADPTRPPSAVAPVSGSAPAGIESVPTGPALQSTMIAPGRKRAVISGKTYSIGDSMGNATIVDIRQYEVVLEQGGRETRLRLVPSVTKETAGRPSDLAKE